MIYQFFFLLYIMLLGLSFLFFFKNRLGLVNLYLLSFPMGLALWAFLLTVLFTLGLPLNRVLVWILGVSILAIFFLNFRNNIFSKKYLKSTLLFLAAFSVFSLVFLVLNYSFFTNDSWRMLIGGEYIALTDGLLKRLIDRGGIFSYVIHSSSHIFGFDYLYALHPVLTFLFSVFYTYNLCLPFDRKDKGARRTLALCLLSVLFVFSSFFILLNAFYVHSNSLFAIFSFFALFGIWKRQISGDPGWLVVSFVSLIALSFLRIEGPIFALVIIILLISARVISFKEKLYYVGILSSLVMIWHIKYVFILSGRTSKYYLTSDRALLVTGLYILALFVLLLSQRKFLIRIKDFLPLIMLYALSIGWTLMIFQRGFRVKGVLVLKKYGILLLNTLKTGDWGIAWIILAVLFALALIIKRVRYESVFLYYIFSSIILFNPIHLYRGGWRMGWGDSGNRMLISLIFLVSFYTFLKFRQGFQRILEYHAQK